ncbi:MAG: hypothetical protein ABEJ75_00945 [Candidatus Nanohaloarchaea archaeon]
MGDIWLQPDEKDRRKEFLIIIMLVFTLLVGSSGLKGNPVYYLTFLASALIYYILMERERMRGGILILLSTFVGLTFTAYMATVYRTEKIVTVIDFTPLLYLVIFGLIVVGLLPENLLSEWKKKLPRQ